eukprot:TRINITY_DN7858_c0_g3_i5.p1 TRINITY_DN7858_c0_g3~~TRINITY_DN7858_c0_g3_i5.p1  ORF type:complete len:409 (+),score=70.44 TRINITY_DN7858_c0_g3_i5:186-1412(+)
MQQKIQTKNERWALQNTMTRRYLADTNNEIFQLRNILYGERDKFEKMLKDRDDDIRHLLLEIQPVRDELKRIRSQKVDTSKLHKDIKDEKNKILEERENVKAQIELLKIEIRRKRREANDLKQELSSGALFLEQKRPTNGYLGKLNLLNKELEVQNADLESKIEIFRAKIKEVEEERIALIGRRNDEFPLDEVMNRINQKENLRMRHRLLELEAEVHNFRTNFDGREWLTFELTSFGSFYLLITFLRETLCDDFLQRLLVSFDKSRKNRNNFLEIYSPFIGILLRTYKQMKKIVRETLRTYARYDFQSVIVKVNLKEMLTNDDIDQDVMFLDSPKDWIENSLLAVIEKKKMHRGKQLDESLFYLLSILYRSQYHRRGMDSGIGRELFIKLQDEILKTANKYLLKKTGP